MFIIFSLVLSGVMFFCVKRNKNNIEKHLPKVFIFTALMLGFIYIFLSPLFTGSDEHNHFYRIYEITEGTVITPTNKYVGSKLPVSLSKTFETASGVNTKVKYKNIHDMWKIKLNRNNVTLYGKEWTSFYSNTALYSPIQYTPQVIGFCVGKIFNFGPYILGMMGRIFNLLAYVFIGYLCIKIVPKAKLFYMLVLLSPNMLQCATTLSADAFTNIIFLLYISIIFKIIMEKKKISKKEKISLFVLSILITLCKIVYFPIVLMLLLMDEKYFDNKKSRILFCVTTICISTIVSLFWIRCTNGVFSIAYNRSVLQRQFILSSPLSYFIVLVRTFAYYMIDYIECLFVGTTMYHSQLNMPPIISFLYVIVIVMSLFNDNKENGFNYYQKYSILVIMVMIIVLISTAIYVQCTAQYFSVANSTIRGIQGRYFIPVILLIPLITKFKNKKINKYSLYKVAMTINLITWFYMISIFMI